MTTPLAALALLLLAAAPAAADDPLDFKPKFTPSARAAAGVPPKDLAWASAQMLDLVRGCPHDDPRTLKASMDARFAGQPLTPDAGKLVGALYQSYDNLKANHVDKGEGLPRETLEAVRHCVADGSADKRCLATGDYNAQLGLRVAVTGFLTKLTKGGLEYLSTLSGVPPRNPVVRQTYPRGLVYDCDVNGGLDEFDAVLVPYGNGMSFAGLVGKETIQKNLSQERVQKAVVWAAREMIKHPHPFRGPAYENFNPKFWTPVDKDNGQWRVLPAVPASKAVQDSLDDAGQCWVECATAVKLTFLLAIKRLMEDPDEPSAPNGDFDKAFSESLIQPSKPAEAPLASVMRRIGPDPADTLNYTDQEEAFIATLQPGDWAYVLTSQNTCKYLVSAGWKGENMVYLGDKKFYAHGPKKNEVTLEEVKEEIRNQAHQAEVNGHQECGEVNPLMVNMKYRLVAEDLAKLYKSQP